MYSDAFTKGNRAHAMNLLRIAEETPPLLSNFRLGLFLGVSFCLIFQIFYWMLTYPHSTFPRFDAIVIIYRMLAMLVLMIWVW